ncbi:hypothetical protein CPLU01_09294 [Colletotrichum plurivorum]|uniref:Prion-inhibition and propagation HeLo domain-containing protein n=1 Tax=Colletotrichum plurivorum TaxID=2175906 RepID=A0A8H6K9C7_9PEZI|nr:hypothetical protein CPLU01_09294 [Colletotrichum plurivorum]
MSAGGLEIFGAVAASVQLIQVAQTCLTIVKDIKRITPLTREQNDARFSLLIQALWFEKWCMILGIQESLPDHGRSTCEDAVLNDHASLQGTPRLKLGAGNSELTKLISEALKDMKERLSEATKILKQYEEPPASSESNQQPSSERLQVPKGKKPSMFTKLLRKDPKPSSSRSASSQSDTILKSSSVLLRTKWVTSDKGRIEGLLKSVEKTNDLLRDLLDQEHQAQVDRQTDMTILDLVDSDTPIEAATTRSDLKAMSKIKLWQKQERKDHDVDDSVSVSSSIIVPNAGQTTRRTNVYQINDFKRGSLPHGDYRTLTSLEDKQVLVEWKHYSRDQPIGLEQTLRLGGLAGLLNRNDVFHKFMTLSCKGLVNDTDNLRIGIVFSIDGSNSNRFRSLQDLIRESPLPATLGQRFRLAKGLIAAIHHLHSVDWLHKSIRSDNIICSWEHESIPASSSTATQAMVPRSGPEGAFAVSRSERALFRPLPPFYLVGWDLSRPDHPMELSETLSVSTAGFKNKRGAILLYSHPEMHAHSSSSKKPRYRAQFDIYSLGLVLLEIGLWRPLGNMRRSCKDDSDFRIKIVTDYCDRLLPMVGEVYWRVVQRCLTNDFSDDSDGGAEKEGFPLQLGFEKFAVSEINKCFA